MEPAPTPEKVATGKPYDKDNSIRRDVGALYDHGVNPVHAIKAMLHEKDGTLATDPRNFPEYGLASTIC